MLILIELIVLSYVLAVFRGVACIIFDMYKGAKVQINNSNVWKTYMKLVYC